MANKQKLITVPLWRHSDVKLWISLKTQWHFHHTQSFITQYNPHSGQRNVYVDGTNLLDINESRKVSIPCLQHLQNWIPRAHTSMKMSNLYRTTFAATAWPLLFFPYGRQLSWYQLCRQWQHNSLSLWQPAVPPIRTKLASWQLSVSVFVLLFMILWG